MNYANQLSKKLIEKNAVIGIVGIGYVGGALAKGASDAGLDVLGFTRNQIRAEAINDQKLPNFTATTDIALIATCDVICICVPTPVHEDKSPDLVPLIGSLQNTAKHMKKGTLIIIESTVAPGTTRNIALPILLLSGLKPEKDFFLSFSPERVDPGNKTYTHRNTPKVVSGLSSESTILTQEFYQNFVETVVCVSSPEVAEMSKILENTFRLVNISLSNELLNYTNKLGIDLWEVINAAATKPFGFLPHYPGPGIGGHCIPVDPFYLLDDATKRGVRLGIIEEAGTINTAQPGKVVNRTLDIIKQTNGVKKTHTALLVGLSYKEDIEDRRESPSLRIFELLQEQKVTVSYHDPYNPEYNGMSSVHLTQLNIQDLDIIVIVTPHSNIDYQALISYERPILDTKNALKRFSSPYIYRL